jgi:hypothetical protein
MSMMVLLLILFSYDKSAPIPSAPAQVSHNWPYKEGIGLA